MTEAQMRKQESVMRKSENKFERERLANNKKKGKKDNNTEEE